MDNRFLCRGKRVDNGEWVQGYYVAQYRRGWAENAIDVIFCTGEDGTFILEIDPATVGRCTGLEDKNGKLIFEGDICIDSLGWVFKVTWDSENARFLGRHDKLRGDVYICYVGREPKVEIIATTHDTPGELGGEKGEI